MVSLCGGKPILVDTKIENDFKITPEELENKINKKTKWFIINSLATQLAQFMMKMI